MNARDERVEAAQGALWLQAGGKATQPKALYRIDAKAALTASDAILRTDEAVERVARAIMLDNPFNDEDEEDLWDVPSIRDHYSGIARAAITALLGEGE